MSVSDKFNPVVNDNIVIPPKQILDRAADYALTEVLVIGRKDDGKIYVAGSHGAPTALMLMLLAQKEFMDICSED